MSLKKRTEGIVFKKRERLENDILFSTFTKDFGRLEILGKGIRKMSSKLKSQIDLFSLVEIEFVEGKEYKILTDSLKIFSLDNLKKNFLALKIGLKICEILDLFLKEEEKEERVWNLLLKTFLFLNKKWQPKNQYHLSFFWFFWNFIVALGIYAPPLFCFECQRELKEGFFDLKEKIFLCPFCKRRNEKIFLPKEFILNLKKFLESDILIVKEIEPKEDELQKLSKISKICFETLKENYAKVVFS